MKLPALNTVLVIGLGMIGGSIARGLKQSDAGIRIYATDRDQEQVDMARQAGVIEEFTGTTAQLVAEVDLIVIAVPVLAVASVLRELQDLINADTVITDVASVKTSVANDAISILGKHASRFVPGHPIAGAEKSGFQAASADLFRNRKVILTPQMGTDANAVLVVNAMWRRLGAEVLGMTVASHDQVLAATSHLPHLLSYALVDVLAHQQQSEDIFRYAAGGFADFSRLASSDPTMWADIFISNSVATLEVLNKYIDKLQHLQQLMLEKNRYELQNTFSEAKNTRDRFVRKFYQTMQSESMETQQQIDYLVEPGGTIKGEVRVPGDKSISHRSIIFGAIANGVTHVTGFLEGEDTLNTLNAFRELGVTIIGPEQGALTIYGVGKKGLMAPRKPLYMGNSGTAMRLLCGLLAAQDFDSELTGDESLVKRPMRRVTDPLTAMGARVSSATNGTPPLQIIGSALHGISYDMPMASAQVKSCLLLAGLYASGITEISEPAPCRDHTERMLAGFGYPIQKDAATGRVMIEGGHDLTATDIDIPADISSAAFFMVAASITPGADLHLQHVGVNPTRTGIIDLLQLMGADIEVSNQALVGGEPVADIRVRYARLKGIDIPEALIPLAIDEFPVLFIASACAAGTTRLRGAEELRVKESDRIQAMADGLTMLGVKCQTFADGIDITGGPLSGGIIDSLGDHRIAMSFVIASLRASSTITVRNCANVATSFPGFVGLANALGIPVQTIKSGTVGA